MRLRNIPGSREAIAESEYVIHEDVMREKRGCWKDTFGNDHPLFLEIGSGKGRFLCTLCERFPSYNYIGVEKYSSVLFKALQKRSHIKECENLLFLRMDAQDLNEVFAPGEVAGIYLNFSDPWPKDRHAHRRLVSHQFLERYRQVLSPSACVQFKTDNQVLFDFALEEAAGAGWEILDCTRDLHSDPARMEGNVMTEYEEKFSAAGNPICRLIYRPGPLQNEGPVQKYSKRI